MSTYSRDYDINTILSLIGKYNSEDHYFDIPLIPVNLEYNVTLNGGEVEIITETSSDNFLTVSSTETINLTDGYNVSKFTQLIECRYIRYRIFIKTTNAQTPRLHILTINGSDQLHRIPLFYSLDMLLLREDILVNHLTDVLIEKYDLKTNYINDILLADLKVNISSLINTFLQMTTGNSVSIDTMLLLVGRYISDEHYWGGAAEYYNVETDVTLNGCEVELIIQTSNDNFSTISDTKTIDLVDGLKFTSISDLPSSKYVRYIVNLKTPYIGVTPRVHRLTMNVGNDQYDWFSPFAFDMFLMNKDTTISYILNVIVGEYYASLLGIDALLKIRTDVKSNIDALLLISNELDINIDTILEKKVKDNYILDILVRAIEDTHYKTDILLSSINRNNVYKDVMLLILDKTSRYKLDARLSKESVEDYIIDTLTSILETTDISVDTILKLAIENNINIDIILSTLNITKQNIIDTLLQRKDALSKYIYDVILTAGEVYLGYIIDTYISKLQETNVELDIILRKTTLTDYLVDVLVSSRQDKNLNLDILLHALVENNANLDTLLNIIGLTKDIYVDTILEQKGVLSQYLIDTYVTGGEVYLANIINICLLKLNETTSYKLDTRLLSEDMYSVLHNIDSLLENKDIDISLLMDAITLIVNEESFNMDILFKGSPTASFNIDLYPVLSNARDYILDLIIKGSKRTNMNFDISTLKSNNELSFAFSILLGTIFIFIDYAKQNSSNLFDIGNSLSSVYEIINTNNSLFEQVHSVGNIFEQIGSLGSSYTLETSTSDIFTMILSNENYYDMILTQEAVDDVE